MLLTKLCSIHFAMMHVSEALGWASFSRAASRGRLRVPDAIEVSETIDDRLICHGALGQKRSRMFVKNYHKSGVKHIIC